MTKLFTPIKLGSLELEHRIAMAPLTRYRADDDRVPLPIVKEYYVQRASTPGTLLITEATLISLKAAGRVNVPGIWEESQVAGWKEVVDAVHAKGCKIFCQLWHLGRAGFPDVLRSHGHKLLSSSAVAIDSTREVPEEMTEEDIWETIADYAAAARNAIKAGFDGVEIHGANGYLPDQFLQDVCNKRTDKWGGSIENRSRFHLEVTKAVVEAVGADRVGMRLSPHSEYLGMRMADPLPTFEYVVAELKKFGLAYLHLVEGRISGQSDTDVREGETNTSLVKIWDNSSPVLLAGGFTPESAREVVDETYKDYDVIVVFGRHFIANPDLVFRLKNNIPLNKYDRPTFYLPKVPNGYIDYPFSQEFVTQISASA
ncbi:FMN-linked oxidoreductase [Coniochaeta sp. PMI_546]|nr:FMN-linked oxidoreductase [Coniochaeta sp. PMI_546]